MIKKFLRLNSFRAFWRLNNLKCKNLFRRDRGQFSEKGKIKKTVQSLITKDCTKAKQRKKGVFHETISCSKFALHKINRQQYSGALGYKFAVIDCVLLCCCFTVRPR